MKLSLPLEDDKLESPSPNQALVDFLSQRRSSKVITIDPASGPSDAELKDILSLAVRVPDHGKLAPWRFLIIAGDKRAELGTKLANLMKAKSNNMDAAHFEIESQRFLRGHTIVALISSPKESIKAPIWEQELSAGALGHNLILSCNGYGYSATWLSEWPMFDDDARQIFGLSAHERLAGFFYIGKTNISPIERGRPKIAELVQYWE